MAQSLFALAPHLASATPPEFFVALISPTNGNVFVSPVDIRVHALTEAPQNAIARVEFFAGTNLLGTATNPSYRLTWSDVPEANHALVAVVYDAQGPVVTSAPPVLITVQRNPTNEPVFAWSQPVVQVEEGAGTAVLVVTNTSHGPAATVHYTIYPATAVGSGPYADFTLPADQHLTFLDGQRTHTITIPIRDDTRSEADEYFMVRLSSPSRGYITNSPIAVVWILNNDGASTNSLTDLVCPDPLPPLGALRVHLVPIEARGQWRFAWENDWRDGGTVAGSLPRDNYAIEFKPVSSHREPFATILPVLAGVTNEYSFEYTNTVLPQLGSLTVLIEPPMLATNAFERAQWQIEGEAVWHDSGASLDALPAQSYAVHFKPVSNWWEPMPRSVSVRANRENQVTARYSVAGQCPGEPPVPLDFDTDIRPSCQQGLPYAYAGQLLSAAGWASGFVVKERVVLTAAYAVFDDVALSFVPEVKWFFQRHVGAYEPPPQVARGWFVLGGYAAQRQADASPGVASVESQNLDVAALYFLGPAGRGGYGGYLVSHLAPGEWLFRSQLQTLIGYPVERIPAADRGKLHATVIQSVSFQQISNQVFSTTDIKSYPGNSGGPLCVEGNDGTFYPAAICLGGTHSTGGRVIDPDVVEVINHAEYASHQSTHPTGGGPELWAPGRTYSPLTFGFADVLIEPDGLIAAGATYWFLEDTNFTFYTERSNRFACLKGQPYNLEFLPVAGYEAPATRLLQLSAGETNVVFGRYQAWGSNYLDGSGRLWVMGSSGSVYRVEHAEVLAPSNGWTLRQRMTLTNSAQAVASELPAVGPAGYYRAVLEP